MQGAVGYSPGVFDLFHVGHLDALRRAKESCERLVVGVFADDLCPVPPVVPLIERKEIVGHVRHVDEVIEITELDLRADWEALGFGLLFTGHDAAPTAEHARHALAGTPVRVLAFDGLAETASPVLRSALSPAARRTVA
ncbi:adenylyltransferase/cytidyltransferase family protein [Spirillospora sp. NPDC047279]|uniref:adenylyltransferase/cytidyltransferase family protein n=1 Tax=Spirillospora sp. NPDC047279 TaxID=3155478 RepID=UPI0033F5B939